ncbi:MAG: cold shock domain-containing protein [Propionibacteriaceae bacterium]|nr:cold shock domain-containing protein [Propionibacteriaceae bacterium]
MPSDRPGPDDERVLGAVRFWREEKGWGAISSDALPPGRDAFAHFSVVELDGFRSLTEGQHVEFTFHPTRQDSFDFIADWVRPL